MIGETRQAYLRLEFGAARNKVLSCVNITNALLEAYLRFLSVKYILLS